METNTTYAIFDDASPEHELFSDLYISTMIACGKDLGMLRDLSRFARQHLVKNKVKILEAPHDSESFIATLVKEGDVAVTCDSDALPFGCSLIVQNIGTPKETWIHLRDVLSALQMTMEQFRIFCVMLGTDFNPRLPKCGPVKAEKCIHSFTNFEEYCGANAPKTMTLQEKLEWVQAAEKSLHVFML
jgi:5'-3' exonuclease